MMEINQDAGKFELVMSATLDNIDIADERLTEYLKKQESPADLFALRILLRESMLNAVTHGSDVDPSKEVRLTFEMNAAETVLLISDQGAGFDWREYQSNIDSMEEGGRGLALMNIYSDNMTYNDKGNEVTLRKQVNQSVGITKIDN
ncbi:MAG: ATP-binding protein [Planctomycetes bacterium]|nr:ATP-binding protein [Planctomycetota bacterium]